MLAIQYHGKVNPDGSVNPLVFSCYHERAFAVVDKKEKTIKFYPTDNPRMAKYHKQVRESYPGYKEIPWET